METGRETLDPKGIRESVPKLSVLIASYQSGEKLYQALKSVRDQTFHDFEIVVCDDGSERFDERQIRTFVGNRMIRILRHETNLGTVQNLNDGLLLCKGEWILLLAADDVLATDDVLSEIIEQAAKTEREWLVGPALLCDKNLRPIGRTAPFEIQMKLLKQGSAREIWNCLCRECFIPSGGAVYRRELLLRFGGFDTHYRLVEDWPFFLKLVRTENLPQVLDKPVILHRSDGVSQKDAGRNQSYQRDLVETMRREILPYLEMLSNAEKKEIEILCRDKEEIFQLRFGIMGLQAKARWFLTHPGTIIRKITRRGKKTKYGDKLQNNSI